MAKLTIDFSATEVAAITAAMEAANAAMPAEIVDPLALDGETKIPNPDLYVDGQGYIIRRIGDVCESYRKQLVPDGADVLATNTHHA